ncbi:MAG: hypothetical protein IIZ78_14600 [Clostridiales bacterium]|nr:hypothetical protein [Clostridiales bacterium]
MSVLFKIGNTDYTSHIVNGTYEVNAEEINDTYTDCNEVNHFIHLATKVKGSFEMAFQTQAEYSAMVSAIASAKSQSTNSWTVTVTPNNTLTQTSIDCRLKFAPKRELTAAGTDIIRRMTMTIEER